MELKKPDGPVVLCILDGFGYAPAGEANAISLAQTPNYDRLLAENASLGPRAFLKTSGLSVGLPDGQMGNSEVGHTNIGAGRVVLQDLPRIDEAVESGTIEGTRAFADLVSTMKETGGAVHLMGLLSPGGVHSHQDHMIAQACLLDAQGIDVRVHAFLDGRDTPPTSGLDFLKEVEAALPERATLATLTGRYYAMDRDKNWERVEKAYHALLSAVGQ